MDPNSHCVSFIGIVDFSENARWLFLSESVYDLLGFEPQELVGTPSLDLAHPDEFPLLRKMHYETIQQDKAAVVAYLRLRHRDPYKGYILCAVSRTVVYNVLVGSVSFATPGPKAMHNSSTAQEITIITPSAKNFEFRRWNDPSPMPPSPVPSIDPDPPMDTDSDSDSMSTSHSGTPSRQSRRELITFDPLPKQSMRVLLVLDRFSVHCPIIYISNDFLISTTKAIGRSFFDFVARREEDIVRSWIDACKSWGVNERGAPSDGGFGFGKFTCCVDGRDSSRRLPEPETSRPRKNGRRERSGSVTNHHHHNSSSRHSGGSTSSPQQPRLRARGSSTSNGKEITVDAIFSAHSDGMMVILRKSAPA